MALTGAAMLGTSGYQVWGTGFATVRAQAELRLTLERQGYPARPIRGGAAGMLRIPRIGVDVAFVEGTGDAVLERGPGHYAETPLPGEGGNVAIAGHRTTHAAPFWAIDTLVPGDHIELETAAGRFLYRVAWQRVVAPGATWVLAPTDTPSLTLTTCEPRFRGTERLVVRAEQVFGPTPGGFVDHRSAGFGLGGELFAPGRSRLIGPTRGG